ncbi:hypothetical protein TSUD_368390 [Trifolium subterraneum]|uniref:RNase H type-1 domain-containing protein n=1 Tax=Trifolium subterraneum TaxID=3900 RepID=A0A2Z6M4I7_TRISU|nr:hypothetical protein TSUD_368390 [Trifolium subterraneum]
MNKAALMKMGWAIRSGEDALWIEVMKGKYDRENRNFEHVVAKAQDSSLWKSLVQTWHYFDRCEFRNIGKGNFVRARTYKWLYKETSIEAMRIMVPESMQYLMVKDLVDDNGCWNFDLLRTWLPHNIISKMYALLPPQNDGDTETRVWSGTDNDQFSIASAYKLNRETHDETRLRPIHPWRYILDCHLQYITTNVNNIALSTRQQMEVDIAWQQPEAGWVVLNTDDTGICSAYLAELWGVLDGLRLAPEGGITKLKVQVDSRVVVQSLNSPNIGNACADALANMGCDHGPGLRVYDQCPSSLSSLLLMDVMEISTSRVISV